VPSPSQPSLLALCVSLGLHGALLASVTLSADLRSPPPLDTLPNSVAMPGNALEIEAPTPELAAAPASPPAPVVPEEDKPVAPRSAAAGEPVTKAEPPAAPKRRTPPAVARSASTPSPPSGSDSKPGAPAAGTFGQEGLAPGVRRLGYAFSRAIPAATPADPAWRELPAGHVGTIRIQLTVDPDKRLGALERWRARPGEPAAPVVLERMVERTLVLLRAGQFALSGSNQPGTERLVIDVTLRDEAAEDEPTNDVVQKRFDGASPGHPGKAYFRYGTGRAFEAKITVVTSGK
jgi:hypothetical protein